jgi:preprotein translocase subunit SecE
VNYNRQQKRAMAKQGLDASRAPESRKVAGGPERSERTTPIKYLSEVRAELRKVDWPTRNEVVNSSIIVLVAVVIMTGLIFVFDWASKLAVEQLIR